MSITRESIINDHPLLYRNLKYLEIPDGWIQIVNELSGILEKEIQKQKDEGEEYLAEAEQVKEKYAGLRFYISLGTEPMYRAIEDFEKLSKETCQTCGGVGRRFLSKSWVYTLCDHCAHGKDFREA